MSTNNSDIIFAQRLKEFRERRGFNQAQLADFLDINSNKTISNWEKGVSTPTIEGLVKISQKMGLTLDQLVLNDSDPLLPPPTFANAEEEKIAFGKMLDIEKSLLHLAERLEQNTQEREAIKREIKLHELALVGLRAQSTNQPPPE